MILFFLTTMLTATAVVRTRGTIEQLIVTPIRPWELVVGKILPYVILAQNMAEVMALGHWWFGVPVRGSLLLILLLSGLFLLSSLGMGLLASTITNTQQEAMLVVWMTLLPALFLSGFFFPPGGNAEDTAMGFIIFPTALLLVIIRSLMLKDIGGGAVAEYRSLGDLWTGADDGGFIAGA